MLTGGIQFRYLYTVSQNSGFCGSGTVDLTAGANTGTVMFPNPVIIPAGATLDSIL